MIYIRVKSTFFFTRRFPMISIIMVINRKKGNVFRYLGIDAWKNKAREAKKQITSIIGEIKLIRH
jgi:hypothetical protein